MPKRKEPELTPEEQFKRFQEVAKEHEIEDRLPEIEQAFDKLATQKTDKSKDQKKKTTQRGIKRFSQN